MWTTRIKKRLVEIAMVSMAAVIMELLALYSLFDFLFKLQSSCLSRHFFPKLSTRWPSVELTCLNNITYYQNSTY